MASRAAKTWFFAKLFAAIGFLAGGSAVFYLGFRAFNPPPPPPGQGLCGNAVLGGLIFMVLGTPLGATACALGAALLGGILDCILPDRPWARREGKATTDALLRLLDDPDPHVRLNALEALNAFAPRQVLESVIAQLLNDADQRIRDAAEQAQRVLREREE